MSAAGWNISGLCLSLIGILVLFRYGMPYRVRTGGAIAYVAEEPDEKEKVQEARYDVLGWIGLILVILGTLFQIAANIPYLIK